MNEQKKFASLIKLMLIGMITIAGLQSAHAAQNQNQGGSDLGFGLGLSTINVAGLGGASLTAIFPLTDIENLQFFVSMPSTSSFNMGAMAFYKRVVVKNQSSGVHLGGGVGFADVNQGTGASLGMTIAGIGGFYFALPGLTRVEAHLDGGLVFNWVDSSPNSQKQLSLGPLSPALGLSVVYYL